MSNRPIVAVVGATGTQGRSVVNALKDSETDYRIRALTRDASKADQLKAIADEVVSADVSDNASLAKAFEGAEVVFAMTITDYHAPDYLGKEARQGKAIMDAAKAAGVKTVIWAGLTSVSELSGGKISCSSFDEKAQVTAYGRSLNAFRLVDVQPAGYMSNHLFYPGFMPIKNDDGSYTLSLAVDADSPYPLTDIETDFGKFAVLALEKVVDTVYASGEMTTPRKIAADLAKASGKEVKLQRTPDEVLRTILGGPDSAMANALVGMFQGINTNGYYGKADAAQSARDLGFKPVSFVEYLEANKAALAEKMA